MDKEELVITRTFDAPREKVWKAWTDQEEVKKWWGPKGFTCPTANIDFKVGGKYHVAMHGPKGTEFDKDLWSTGIYKEIIPPEKLVMTDSFSDENGNIVSAIYYGMSKDFPMEMSITIIMEEEDGKTRLILKHSPVHKINEKDQSDMEQGWNQSLDKLEEVLKEMSA